MYLSSVSYIAVASILFLSAKNNIGIIIWKFCKDL